MVVRTMARHGTQPPVPLEEPACLLCGSDRFDRLLSGAQDLVWSRPGSFTVARCRECGLVLTRPRPTADGLKFYYEKTYTAGWGPSGSRRVLRYRLRVLARVHALGRQDRLLDVGCGTGAFLRYAREHAGCDASGIDIDADLVERARALGGGEIACHAGTLMEFDGAPGSYSVITFFESLEHHPDPLAALRRARDLLAPGGVCAVEVPNFSGFWRRVFRTYWMPLMVPQHLVHFEPATLKKMVEAAGFEVRHHQAMFYPLEGVASLAFWLWRVLRLPRRGQLESWSWLLVPFVLILLLVFFVVVEIPVQAILRAAGASGHQTVVGGRS